MLERLKKIIENGRFIITLIAVSMAVVGLLATFFMLNEQRANSNMLDYLNQNSDSHKGLQFFADNFGIKGDAMLAVESLNQDDSELKSIIDGFWKIRGVTQIIWYGTLEDFDAAFALLSLMLSLSGKNPNEVLDIDTLKEFLRKPTQNGYVYSVLIMTKYSPASAEAANILKQMNDRLSPRGVSFAGMTYTADTVMKDTIGELPFYLVFGGLALLVMLFLMSFSVIEPIVAIMSSMIAIAVNLGLNYLFPTVSVISFAVSSLIQLCCVVIYSVYVSRLYRLDVDNYFERSFKLVIPSALAASVSLIPLVFMDFGLGYDLAPTLIKSVLVTALTILILTPSLLTIFNKAILPFKARLPKLMSLQQKTTNLADCPKPIAYLIDKGGIVVAAVSALLLVAALVLQSFVGISHFKLASDKSSYEPHEIAAQKLANQLIVSVPVLTVDEKSPQDCIYEIESLDYVDKVISIFSIIKLSGKEINSILNLEGLKIKELDSFFAMGKDGQRYTLFTITLLGNADSPEAVTAYNRIVDILQDYYGVSYRFGVVSAVSDMSQSVVKDFWIINLISLAFVFLVYLLFTKSLYKSFIFTALLELAMLMPILIFAMVWQSINFFIYILSGVQAFAMVNYTLMIYNGTKEQNSGTNRQKVKVGIKGSLPSIWASSISFGVACLLVGIISNNLIVKEMAILMTLNCLCSAFVSTFILPSLLSMQLPLKKDIKAKHN